MVGCNETTIIDHPYVERWSQTENHLRLKNGSELYFMNLKDEAALVALLSLDVRFFGIDQAEEVPEAAFLKLISRIGRTDIDPQTGEKLPPAWGAAVGNPAGHNWCWKMWKKSADANGRSGRFHIEEARTDEGPYVSSEYIARLKEAYPDSWYKRYVLGSWEAASGLIYDEFDPKVHVIEPFPIRDSWKAGLGVDLGYNHPTAFEWVAVDYMGNWYIYDEHVGREMTPHEHASVIKDKGIQRVGGAQLPIYAPHDAMNRSPIDGVNLQQAYADEGVMMLSGTKLAPVVRIMRLKQKMKIRPDVKHPFTGKMGSPQFFIMKNCEKLIENVGLYNWKELKPGEEETREEPDEVVKVHDDEWDAVGYWAMGWTSRGVPEKPHIKTEEELDIEAIIEMDLLKREAA